MGLPCMPRGGWRAAATAHHFCDVQGCPPISLAISPQFSAISTSTRLDTTLTGLKCQNRVAALPGQKVSSSYAAGGPSAESEAAPSKILVNWKRLQTPSMGWFTSSHHSDRKPTGELRANVETLLADNPALQMFASEGCLARFLVARCNSVHNATCALRKTLQWRARFKPECIYWDDVKDCASGGRLELLSQPDKSGRPILLYRLRQPSKKGTTAEEYMRFWVYMLECTSRLADNRGAGKAVVVFDMHGYSDPHTIMPTFLTRIELVRTAQAHYPERLALAVVCNPPFVFWALWRSVVPFLDPITKSKVHFASNIEQIQSALQPTVAPELLYESLGGSRPEKFEFMQLDQLMRSIDAERRAELSAASLLTAKAAHADGGEPLLDAKPLNGRHAVHA